MKTNRRPPTLRESVPVDLHRSVKRWAVPRGIEKETFYDPSPETGDYEGWTKGLPPEVQEVVRRHLQSGRMTFLGSGSSRTVFGIGRGSVVKIAMNAAGVAQNRNETRLSRSPLQRFVARVWKSSPDGKWIVMEEVSPDRTMPEFLEVPNWVRGYGTMTLWRVVTTPDLKKEALEQGHLTPFQKDLVETLDQVGLEPSDALVPGHWGVTKDGRPVLMDYGNTIETFDAFYA